MSRVDVSEWKKSFSYKVVGSKGKMICIDPETSKHCIVKFRWYVWDKLKRETNTNDLNEKLTSEIYELIGLPHAKVRLGVFNGAKCAIIDFFCEDNDKTRAVHFGNSKNLRDLYTNISLLTLQGEENAIGKAFDMMLKVIKQECLGISDKNFEEVKTRFFENVLGASLVENWDLNIGNFAAIRNRVFRTYALAPAFDTEKAFKKEM